MESGLLSMAQQFSGLPMDALIGGPLNAAANANAAMALTQTKFLLDTCFSKTHVDKQDEVKGVPEVIDSATGMVITPGVIATPEIPAHDDYAPIMIVMSLSRPLIIEGSSSTPAEIKNISSQFNLPLLTIIPLNSLAVETVDISFDMEVKSSFSEDLTEEKSRQIKAEASFEAKAGWGPCSVSIKGSASYDSKDSSTHNTHYEKSNSAKYSVKVHAGQLPLPKGVNTIIEAFTQSIQPITLNNK